MAHLVTEQLIISVSRVSKDLDTLEKILNDELASTLEEVVQQLIGDQAVVEVEQDKGE